MGDTKEKRRVLGDRSSKTQFLIPNPHTVTHHEFLNLGIFSSFKVSAAENLDATAHPLQNME